MSSRAAHRFPTVVPAFLGVWAAAIALAPAWKSKAILIAPAIAIPALWWTVAKPARWVGLFLLAALLLPPLPFPIGDSGPHPALIVAAIGLFAGLLRLREWRWLDRDGADGKIAGPMIAVFGVLLASVASAAVFSGPVAAAGSL